MIVPAEIEQKFGASQSLLRELQKRVRERLLSYTETNSYLFEDRIKTLQSVAEKLESGRYKCWSEIDDLYGCTVVVPLVSDEEKVLNALQGFFHEHRTVRRGKTKKPPDVFRFDSPRFWGKLKPTVPVEKGENVFDFLFEVQVKSVFEYAWSKTTHALSYKSPDPSWERQRLAAQLKAAVEQVEMIIAGYESNLDFVVSFQCEHVTDQKELVSLFQKLFDSKLIPSELAPKDWSRFASNLYCGIQALSGKYPSGTDYRRLHALDKATKILEKYFKDTENSKIPRTMSLFQIAVAALWESGEFQAVYQQYVFPVTDEATYHFTNLEKWPANRFSFELGPND